MKIMFSSMALDGNLVPVYANLKGHCHLQKSCKMYFNCMSRYGVNATDHEYHIQFSQILLNFSQIEVILSGRVTSSQRFEGFGQ